MGGRGNALTHSNSHYRALRLKRERGITITSPLEIATAYREAVKKSASTAGRIFSPSKRDRVSLNRPCSKAFLPSQDGIFGQFSPLLLTSHRSRGRS